MRTTPYGEPSDKEIDALHQPPACEQCGEPVQSYGDLCESCEDQNEAERRADILQDDLKYPND
jgi:predicted amidophosphoribosyltransferase